MWKTVFGAAALLVATGAQAQKADEFRVIAGHDGGIAMVSTLVTGPQTARRLTEVIIRTDRSQSGADAYSVDIIVDCNAGSVRLGESISYQDMALLRRSAADPSAISVPPDGSVAYRIAQYACTGDAPADETDRVIGILPAIAWGRHRLGLDG